MISVRKAGFTIIEVMLFLAISGLLFVGIIASTGSAINVQRYRDSVASLQSILQQQYTEVSNVINDNNQNVCTLLVDSDPINRGQSECVILGRFIESSGGNMINVHNIIGRRMGSETVNNDISALRQYGMTVSDDGKSTYEVEWGAKLADVTGGQKDFTMVILRSPLSGVVRTFLDNSTAPSDNDEKVTSMLEATFLTNTQVELCVDSNGLFTGPKMAVLIGKNSTNASGIQTLGDDDQKNLGDDFVCR